ncbi:MAG: protein kinase domain-containing protein [Ktedonobacteraceae bacterium]
MADKVIIGQQLGNYQILRLLDKGGFAQVFLAEHVYLNTQAAVKVLSMQLGSGEIEWFLREARTIARLVHPNIVRVLDFGVQDNLPFLVLDYAPNGTLRQAYPKGQQLPLPAIVSSINQAAEALQYAHDEKFIHRDVKPENLLLGRRNEVLLSDFGLSLVAQSTNLQGLQELAGTITYIAPEQIQGNPRPASDQYSLGIIAYEWLTGQRLFRGSFTEVLSQQLTVSPPPLRQKRSELSPTIEQVVLRALEKDYSKRFDSVREFAQALEEAVGLASFTSGQLAAPVSTPTLELKQTSASPQEQKTDLPIRQSGALVVNEPTPTAPAVQIETAPIGTMLCAYRGHSAPVRSLAWNPDGQRIISASGEKTIHIWDGRTGDNLHIYRDIADSVLFVGWSADGRYVATAGSDMQVRVWDFTTNRLVSVYSGHTRATITAFAWSPSPGEPLLATGSNGAIHVWEATAARPLTIYRSQSANISALAWSPDGKNLVSGSTDGSVQVWQAATGKTLAIYTEVGQAAGVLSVAWSPEALGPLLGFPRTSGQSSSCIACGRANGLIQMWEVATDRQVLSYRHSAPVHLLSWSLDARRFAYSSDDATVLVWDTLTNLKLYTFSHTASAQVMVWSPDSKYLASGGGDNTVQVWVAP